MIRKLYEIWCDDHAHEADGQLLLEGTKKTARAQLVKLGWRLTSDGRSFCPDCVEANAKQHLEQHTGESK